ncbi:MAG: integrase arm-type DNA-binding domain-containing protein [Azoarcus sp.]|jgi:integrase|nr:integrase arm-type DNA-binding domain-containing protein [Azoarcus sp.]
MPLTDIAVRTAKPKAQQYKLPDERGLYLLVHPNGGKYWRLRYYFLGKEKLLAIGVYPDVSLKDARERRDEARKLAANGTDPGVAKKAKRAAAVASEANTFEAVAREWFMVWSAGVTPKYSCKVINRLEQDVFPWIGGVPVADLTRPMIADVLFRTATRTGRSHESKDRQVVGTAHRELSHINQVMEWACVHRGVPFNPCYGIQKQLPKEKTKHHAAITDPVKARELLLSLASYKGSPVIRTALALAPLVFQRPGEFRKMKWADIDLDAGEWRFSASKTHVDHMVPLARQAVALLRGLHPLTGRGEYVFRNRQNHADCMAEDAINNALRRLGWDTQKDITGHGFRAMARTILAERLKTPPDVIEMQLAHKVPDRHGEAYNRAKYIDERRRMMQAWADYLDELKAGPQGGAKVIQLRGAA